MDVEQLDAGRTGATDTRTPGNRPGISDRWGHRQYVVKKKIFKLVGGEFRVYDPSGNLAFFSKMKAFKLKEDIRVYADESMQQELLLIQARQIIDFAAAYDVSDSTSGQKVGALRRRGLRSMLRDEWLLLDPADDEIGLIQEDSMALALIRRFLSNLVPQHYEAKVGESKVFTLKQNFNPFTLRLTVDFMKDSQTLIDRRLAIGACVLLCAIEGRQG
ncbi:MAG: hypothetical protein C4521_10670 [Actinobacteria bacterium]|nr:MAG: hypothetical protein C4521_10670 [Actinomycetota bacterium]